MEGAEQALSPPTRVGLVLAEPVFLATVPVVRNPSSMADLPARVLATILLAASAAVVVVVNGELVAEEAILEEEIALVMQWAVAAVPTTLAPVKIIPPQRTKGTAR